jgi:hypothetical protein
LTYTLKSIFVKKKVDGKLSGGGREKNSEKKIRQPVFFYGFDLKAVQKSQNRQVAHTLYCGRSWLTSMIFFGSISY